MCSRVEKVTQENSRLHTELRKSLEVRIEAVTQQPTYQQPKSNGGPVGEEGLGTIQQQLNVVTKDRDNYRELLKKMSQELELLQRNDQVSFNRLSAVGGLKIP